MADPTSPRSTAKHPRLRSAVLAEERFRARIAELGATVAGEYLNTRTPVPLRCPQGHSCNPRPSSVLSGQGICRVCAGQDPTVSEAAFRARVEELGGTVRGRYVNALTPVEVRCAQGHPCAPMPASIQQGQGICGRCAGKDPADAAERFRVIVEAQGEVMLTRYVNGQTAVLLRCHCGYEHSVWPSDIRRGGAGCRRCWGESRRAASAFRNRVEELGGIVVGEYFNNLTPVHVRCRDGHEVSPLPINVFRGTGVCRYCAGKTWDCVYVVRGGDIIKFGITSGSPGPRLMDHQRNGFTDVVRVHAGLPDEVAPELERQIVAALRDAKEQPVRGREYFPAHVLALVLDLIDNHPAIRP